MKQPTRSSSLASTSKITPCCTKLGLKRGPWTPDEDEVLSNYIKKEGEGQWRTLPKRAGLLRCGKSCRLRWMNYLRPSVKRGQITLDEEDLILRLHRLLGNRWALIAGRIPGRTDNEIKNYWNTHLSKKLISQGIDPRTHKPLNPNPSSSTFSIQPSPAPKQKSKISSEDVVEQGNDQYHNGSSSLDQDHNWMNSNGLMMNLESNNERDDIGLCNDEVFTSFLDSLINDDTLDNQHKQPINMSLTHENMDVGATWNAALSSSSPAFDHEDEHRQFVDQANRKSLYKDQK